nr:MAG TPA: hypothetical protein [Caudoviricetes sp.]
MAKIVAKTRTKILLCVSKLMIRITEKCNGRNA